MVTNRGTVLFLFNALGFLFSFFCMFRSTVFWLGAHFVCLTRYEREGERELPLEEDDEGDGEARRRLGRRIRVMMDSEPWFVYSLSFALLFGDEDDLSLFDIHFFLLLCCLECFCLVALNVDFLRPGMMSFWGLRVDLECLSMLEYAWLLYDAFVCFFISFFCCLDACPMMNVMRAFCGFGNWFYGLVRLVA